MKRILIIATDGFEQSELEQPKKLLEEAGAETVVASLETGTIKGWEDGDWGSDVQVETTVDKVSADDFDGLLLPGGQINPDVLRLNDTVIDLIKSFDKQDKPIAAICHAPWLLIEAGLVDGKVVTAWPSVRTDLKNAGGDVIDRKVAVDGNLITSRNPDDIPAFTEALIDAVKIPAENVVEHI
ncbi:type 1 glutamine amidotransferase [Erythrobacter sp. SCSIO 43205]|uniref:type 1 glutamine amidotransferase domain-containing protein n=1 Tax=Erythrobacter sp. SCSIO 43205 TaxID=2779361 RepID=UPI001CA9C469|nr:type 1 glutamine amidotransferase domain-containing protein [Erythrobacter sp. SCSIO 43205]UAB79418.1 type 1 glutamine amidotransferase [Erythrobacter sp. SCSIO 43205]